MSIVRATVGIVICGVMIGACSSKSGTSTDSGLDSLPTDKRDGVSETSDVGVDQTAVDSVVVPEVPFPTVWGPEVATDINPSGNVVEVNLTASSMKSTVAEIELDLLGYNKKTPGPLIHARVGDEIIVHFKNDFDQPTTIHWHGLRISDKMDGSPRLQDPVKPGETFTYQFKAVEAGSFWYHPHVMTNQQLERGLYGPIVIRGVDDPEYDQERYLMLDDILIDYTNKKLPPFLADHMEEMHGRFGNTLLTNGQSSDEVKTTAEQGDVERWRIVNTANARTMTLSVEGASFRVIGTDGGLLATPYTTEKLLVAIGQRYDLEVTYDKAGTARLLQHVQVHDETTNQPKTVSVPMVSVEVTANAKTPRTISFPNYQLIPERTPTKEVEITLNAQMMGSGHLAWQINGVSHGILPIFQFDKGETVKITITNFVGMEHPFHLHGQFFRIVDQQNAWTSQPGLKDTVFIPGNSTVEIIAYMDNPGLWMAHCHILEHAELGMMSEIIVHDKK